MSVRKGQFACPSIQDALNSEAPPFQSSSWYGYVSVPRDFSFKRISETSSPFSTSLMKRHSTFIFTCNYKLVLLVLQSHVQCRCLPNHEPQIHAFKLHRQIFRGRFRHTCSSAPLMIPHRMLQYVNLPQPSGSSTKSASGLSSSICLHSSKFE